MLFFLLPFLFAALVSNVFGAEVWIRSVDELIEENDFLRQQFNEAYEGNAKKESVQNLTAIEKLLVNVDELLGENRRLKGLNKSKNIIS